MCKFRWSCCKNDNSSGNWCVTYLWSVVAGRSRGGNVALKKLLQLKRYVSSSNAFESVGFWDLGKDKNKSIGIQTRM